MIDARLQQKIWLVYDIRDATYRRTIVGNDYELVFTQAMQLTGIPKDSLVLEDTGRTKPACNGCGKR